MARRRKRDDDLVGLVAQLAALLALLSLISPQVRQAIHSLGLIAIFVLAVVVLGLISFGVYRLATRSKWDAPTMSSTFTARSKTPSDTAAIPQIQVAEPPTETQSAAQFFERLHTIDWFQFEKLVALVYRKLGYAVTRRGGANPDGGIDLVVEKDGVRSAVQCKQWKAWNVGVKTVREFLGALTDTGISKGVLVTLNGYTGDAKQLAEKHGIEIVNETGIATMLESVSAGFDPEVLAILNDSRKFCPKCESEMVLRTATKGLGAGKQFWGCSSYPRCRFTMPV